MLLPSFKVKRDQKDTMSHSIISLFSYIRHTHHTTVQCCLCLWCGVCDVVSIPIGLGLLQQGLCVLRTTKLVPNAAINFFLLRGIIIIIIIIILVRKGNWCCSSTTTSAEVSSSLSYLERGSCWLVKWKKCSSSSNNRNFTQLQSVSKKTAAAFTKCGLFFFFFRSPSLMCRTSLGPIMSILTIVRSDMTPTTLMANK